MGLFKHPGFETAIQVAQAIGHVVEAGCQLAEFIAPARRQSHTEIGCGHALHALTQTLQRQDDHQEGQVHQGDRAGDRQPDQTELEHGQQIGAARQIILDAEHQDIGGLDKGGHFAPGERCRHAVQRALRDRPQYRPARLDAGEQDADLRIGRQQQRSRRVATLEGGKHAVEFAQLRRQFVAHGRRQTVTRIGKQISQAVGAHTQAAGIVDRRRATLKLPRHQEGHADRHQRDHQEHDLDGDDLRTQGTHPHLAHQQPKDAVCGRLPPLN